jgi:sulfur-oxidizing protein SoxB
MTLNGKPMDADKRYKVASWGTGGESGQPIWEVVMAWLKSKKTVNPKEVNVSHLAGVEINPGISL